MNNKPISAALFILSLSIFSAFWLQLGQKLVWLHEGLYLITVGLAVAGGIFALRTYGLQGARTATLLFLTLGIGSWFLGELLYYYFYYIVHQTTFPSAADIFYLLAYPLLICGFVNEIRISQVNFGKIPTSTKFLLAIVALCLSILVCYFGIFRAFDPHVALFANLIAMSYGIGDLLLIVMNILVLVLVWEFKGGSLSRVWFMMFIGFVFTLIADILFAIYTVEYEGQIWFYRSLLDTFWMFSYLLIAYAFFDFGFSIKNTMKQLKKIRKEVNNV